MPKSVFTVSLATSYVVAIEKIAQDLQVTRSEIVRLALVDWLNARKAKDEADQWKQGDAAYKQFLADKAAKVEKINLSETQASAEVQELFAKDEDEEKS